MSSKFDSIVGDLKRASFMDIERMWKECVPSSNQQTAWFQKCEEISDEYRARITQARFQRLPAVVRDQSESVIASDR